MCALRTVHSLAPTHSPTVSPMSLLRTLAAALARTLARAATAARHTTTRPAADATDGYEAWLAESFPEVR